MRIRSCIAAVLFCVAACTSNVAGDPVPVSLALQWLPQAQFAGYYTALDKGFYAEEGLDMTIIPGGPGIVSTLALETGKADFATAFLSTAVARHLAGVPIVNIAQMVQHSSILIVARAGSDIKSIIDFNNRKISMWDNEFLVQPLALFRQKKIQVVRVPLGNSLELFFRGAVAGTMAMWYNEYHTLLSSGFRDSDLVTFFMRDTDFDFPEDGLYCRQETLDRDPETARAFVRASLRGWRYAFDHEDEALAGVERRMTEQNLPASRTHQRWMLRRMKDLIAPGTEPFPMGRLDRDAFSRVVTALKQVDAIQDIPYYDMFHRGLADE